MRPELGFAILTGLAFGLALLAWKPAERIAARRALGILLFTVFVELVSISTAVLGWKLAPSIAANIAVVTTGVVLLRLGGLLLFRGILPALHIGVARLVEDIVSTVAMLAWGFIWLGLVGLDLASLVTTSAVITAVIAFAMQDTLGNILGGIVLQVEDSIKVGDWVVVDTIGGRVTEVRWRYTAIETRNRETVYVPNSALVKNRFMVIGSRADMQIKWRRWLWFNVELDAVPTRVCETLINAVVDAEIPGVLGDPRPNALLMDTNEGCARYALRYWLGEPRDDDPTDATVRAHALAGLRRAGIRLALRREERLVVANDEARVRAIEAEDVARRRTALSRVELFAPLNGEEREVLAGHLIYAPFLQGDVVTRQGAVAHWLYLIIAGEADVVLDGPSGRTTISVLRSGEIFGERGMLTGEPRSATVVAHTDLECYRLDKEGLHNILHRRPDIAEQISRILETRINELGVLRAAQAEIVSSPQRRSDLLARMRAFFGLDLAAKNGR